MVDVNEFDINSVIDREDFVNFIRELAADFEVNGSKWKNGNVGDFLDALAEWILAAPHWAQNMYTMGRHAEVQDVDIPTWQIFARALRVARTYE